MTNNQHPRTMRALVPLRQWNSKTTLKVLVQQTPELKRRLLKIGSRGPRFLPPLLAGQGWELLGRKWGHPALQRIRVWKERNKQKFVFCLALNKRLSWAKAEGVRETKKCQHLPLWTSGFLSSSQTVFLPVMSSPWAHLSPVYRKTELRTPCSHLLFLECL